MPDAGASEQVGIKLQSLYESLPPDEQKIIDFVIQQAVEHVGQQAEVQGFTVYSEAAPGAGTQDAMKRVLFGAAGVTGGFATPGCINWLVASARDANLFS